jgi:thymidylate synthase (FAD)
MVVTANFREWRHILKLRTAPEAQWEIRELCAEIGKILVEKAPSVFEDVMKEVR